jgi:hypothetical protein
MKALFDHDHRQESRFASLIPKVAFRGPALNGLLMIDRWENDGAAAKKLQGLVEEVVRAVRSGTLGTPELLRINYWAYHLGRR